MIHSTTHKHIINNILLYLTINDSLWGRTKVSRIVNVVTVLTRKNHMLYCYRSKWDCFKMFVLPRWP